MTFKELFSFGFPKYTDEIYELNVLQKKKIKYRFRRDASYLYLLAGIILVVTFLIFVLRLLIHGVEAILGDNVYVELTALTIVLLAGLASLFYTNIVLIKPKRKLLRITAHIAYFLVLLALLLLFFDDARKGYLNNQSPKLTQALPLLFVLLLIQPDSRLMAWINSGLTVLLICGLALIFHFKFDLTRFHLYVLSSFGFMAMYLSIHAIFYKMEVTKFLLRRKEIELELLMPKPVLEEVLEKKEEEIIDNKPVIVENKNFN